MSYSVESAYDPQANLRLLRTVGDDIPDHVLLSIGRADPTGHLIPTAKNLVDIRGWRYQGSVIEIETRRLSSPSCSKRASGRRMCGSRIRTSTA